MAINVQTYTTPPEALLRLLNARLPTSLPLLRRLQFTTFPIGASPETRIVFVSNSGPLEGDAAQTRDFTAAWFDFSSGPDTQMWMYSTLEDPSVTGVDEATYELQLAALVQEISRLNKIYGRELIYPNCLLVGTMHSRVRELLEKTGRVRPRITGNYDKWLFRAEDLPNSEDTLPEGMHWDTATLDDCHMVVSRTDIPRQAKLLEQFKNLFIKLEDKTPIAWAFLAPDGSLASLQCEEPYRRRGLAKALTAKLFREGTHAYGHDGWCSADVSADNDGSRGMCKSLNGTTYWVVSWLLLDIGDAPSS